MKSGGSGRGEMGRIFEQKQAKVAKGSVRFEASPGVCARGEMHWPTLKSF